MEDEMPIAKKTSLAKILSQSLDTLGVEELQDRKKQLKREIKRVEAEIEQKKATHNAAEALFGKSN